MSVRKCLTLKHQVKNCKMKHIMRLWKLSSLFVPEKCDISWIMSWSYKSGKICAAINNLKLHRKIAWQLYVSGYWIIVHDFRDVRWAWHLFPFDTNFFRQFWQWSSAYHKRRWCLCAWTQHCRVLRSGKPAKYIGSQKNRCSMWEKSKRSVL